MDRYSECVCSYAVHCLIALCYQYLQGLFLLLLFVTEKNWAALLLGMRLIFVYAHAQV